MASTSRRWLGHIHQQAPTPLVPDKPPARMTSLIQPRLLHQGGPDQNGLADRPLTQKFSHLQHHRVEAPIIGHTQLDTVAPAGMDHAPAFLRVHGHRLLTQHVFAVFSRRYGLGAVQPNRRRQVNGLQFGVADQFPVVGIAFGNGMPGLKLGQALSVAASATRQPALCRCLNGLHHPLFGNIRRIPPTPTPLPDPRSLTRSSLSMGLRPRLPADAAFAACLEPPGWRQGSFEPLSPAAAKAAN